MAHHTHNHNHQTSRSARVLFVAALNVVFTVIEIIGGILTNSVAILSDALHDFGDSIALISSYFAEKQAERPADKKRTFGYGRASLFSAVFNAVILIVGSIFVLIEALKRLVEPEPVHALGMLFLALFGVVVNSISYLHLRKGESANEHMLSWHLLEDVIGWASLLVGALIMYFTDFFLIDPILTVFYTIFILWGVLKSLREVGNIFMQGVPKHIDLDALSLSLTTIPGVVSVHDIHVWSLEGETDVFTGHIAIRKEYRNQEDSVLAQIKEELQNHHIEHSTIELEVDGQCHGPTCN